MNDPNSETRQYFRIPEDQGIPIQLILGDDFNDFESYLWGLVFNESSRGCAVILVADQVFELDQICLIKFPDLSPLRTRIAWVKVLNPNIMMLGLEYLIMVES